MWAASHFEGAGPPRGGPSFRANFRVANDPTGTRASRRLHRSADSIIEGDMNDSESSSKPSVPEQPPIIANSSLREASWIAQVRSIAQRIPVGKTLFSRPVITRTSLVLLSALILGVVVVVWLRSSDIRLRTATDWV